MGRVLEDSGSEARSCLVYASAEPLQACQGGQRSGTGVGTQAVLHEPRGRVGGELRCLEPPAENRKGGADATGAAVACCRGRTRAFVP